MMEIWTGNPYPLGATWDGNGVNFALFSENATGLELCLFDDETGANERRIQVEELTNRIWHIYLPGIGPGQLYGYRVSGPYEPEKGHRFNPHKLLLDPYAKAISGKIKWDDSLFGYDLGNGADDLSLSESDSAAFLPKSVVIDPRYDWGDDHHPDTPLHKTIIYEAHVKGFTERNPQIPAELRGKYLGMSSAPAIDYLKNLGITAVELMPIHQFITDRYLLERGLTNYWGYNTIGFFAPESRYALGVQGEQVREFKDMVKAYHAADIEVILDVVYNHTAEGNQMGPTLCFRGIDNAAYYRLVAETPRFYMDYTGTGNTLNMVHPQVLQLLMDSLRYWVKEMHVDGFRFDLASALARELHDVDRLGSFFDVIHQDPVLSQVKLIAEPWDIGEGGYQVGGFPVGWGEWNGKYRDTVRDFWRGEESKLPEFANRLTGSSDLYSDDGRLPTASINFITAHDGFSLRDLVSYNNKHNEANGEENRDGESNNRSWNCGVEGPTEDAQILALRAQMQRNYLSTLFLSQGVAMLLAGDEMGHTQHGNNNAYCQDNEISWLDWQTQDCELQEFTRGLIRLTKDHPVFQQRKWFQGRAHRGKGATDIAWFQPSGENMTNDNWQESQAKTLAVFLNGLGIPSKDPHGKTITDQSFFLMFNAHYEAVPFSLPTIGRARQWKEVINTAQSNGIGGKTHQTGDTFDVAARSLLVLQSQ